VDIVEELKPTWFNLTPAMYAQLLMHTRRDNAWSRWPGLRFLRTGSASMTEQMHGEIEQTFGAPLVHAYGSTETNFMAITSTQGDNNSPPGSVGKPHSGVVIRRPTGEIVEVGVIGEIWVSGPTVAEGYYNNPDASAERFVDGCFRTGDAGFTDAEGFLFLTGRMSELINRGGEIISPSEIESALETHPAIRQAAVFAVQHEILGQEVAAACTLKPGARATAAEARAYVSGLVSWAKVPKKIHFVDELPVNANGKVQKSVLASLIE
jgi:acyl-CoA synthetase (AMP-forming)/AMP-acid ligase II